MLQVRAIPGGMQSTFREADPRQLGIAKSLSDAGVGMIEGTEGGSYLGPGLSLGPLVRPADTLSCSPLTGLFKAGRNRRCFGPYRG